MQAIRDKFRGHEDEIRQDVVLYGSSEAARRRGQKQTMAWDNYCQELMGAEPFSYITEAMLKSDDTLLKDLAVEIVNILLRQSATIKELKDMLETERKKQEVRSVQRRLETVRLLQEVRETT